MLERLSEEVSRCERHGTPLSLILGEVVVVPVAAGEADDRLEERVRGWISSLILKSKRRSDMAGQYGPSGFLALLPLTDAEGAEEFCRRLTGIQEAEPCPGLPPSWQVRVGYGVASYSAEHSSAKNLLRVAEEHLGGTALPGEPPPIRPSASFGSPGRNP
jgi:GGDEF domain-containing protein